MHSYEEAYRMGQVRTAKITEPDDFIVSFAQTLRRKGCQTVLDVGCRAGRNAVFLAEEGFYVVGVDISPTALGLALEKARSRSVKRCVFLMHDFLELPFPDAHFDAAFSCYAIENMSLSGIRKALSEMRRVVEDGGLILVTLHSPKHWRLGQGKEVGHNTFMVLETIKGKPVRFITHFFEKKDAGKLFQNLNLEILSITELVDESDKRRAHWVVLSEKQSQKKKEDGR